MIFSTIVALAFSVSAFARPMPQLNLASLAETVDGLPVTGSLLESLPVPDLKRSLVDAAVAAPVDVLNGVVAREVVEYESVVVLFTDCKTTIGPYVAQIKALTAEEIKAGQLVAILAEIVAALQIVLVGLKGLVGQPLAVILCEVGGTVQVALSVVATLVADLIADIFCALYLALKLVDFDLTIVAAILVQLGSLIAEILTVLFGLVDGLLAIVLSALEDAVTLQLGCTLVELLSVLQLNVVAVIFSLVLVVV